MKDQVEGTGNNYARATGKRRERKGTKEGKWRKWREVEEMEQRGTLSLENRVP